MSPVPSPPRFYHQHFAVSSIISIHHPSTVHSSISFFDAFQSRLQTSYTSHKHVSDLKALQVVTLCSQGCSDPSWEALTASKPQLPLCTGDVMVTVMMVCLPIPSTKGCKETAREKTFWKRPWVRKQAPIPGYRASGQSCNCQIKFKSQINDKFSVLSIFQVLNETHLTETLLLSGIHSFLFFFSFLF